MVRRPPGREDEGGHPGRRPRRCRPRHWTRGIRALVEGVVHGIVVSFTTGSSRPRSPGPRIPPSPIGGRPLMTGYSCVWRRSRGQAPPAASLAISTCFMVHKGRSSQQFLDDLATHLGITTGFTIPFGSKEHFSFTQEWYWALVPRRWGSRRACGWRQPVSRGWCVEQWTAPLCGTGSRP